MKKRLAAPTLPTVSSQSPLLLDPNLGQSGAAALRAALVEATATAEPAVRLDGQRVEQLGTGSLQVLLAASAALERQGRKLVIEQPSARLCDWARLAGVAWLVAAPAGESGRFAPEER